MSGYEIGSGNTIGDGTLSSLFHVTNLGVNHGSTLFNAEASAAQRFGVGLNLAVGGASVVSTGDRDLQQALRALSIAGGVWNTETQAISAYQTTRATMEALRPTPIQARAGGGGFAAVTEEPQTTEMSQNKRSTIRQINHAQNGDNNSLEPISPRNIGGLYEMVPPLAGESLDRWLAAFGFRLEGSRKEAWLEWT